MNISLARKVALVTGGANGLGRMIAEGLLEAGAHVIVTSRRDAADAARQMSDNGRCDGINVAFGTAGAYDNLKREVAKLTTTLDIIVNNAGRTWGAPIEEFPDDAWGKVMETNVHAPFFITQRLLPFLEQAACASDPGRIINIGSVAGRTTQRLGAFSYGASKAALHHLTRELAADLASRHITVNTVVPGYFPTRMTSHIRDDEQRRDELTRKIPLGRLGEPSDIAGACVFLASRYASYVTGSELWVDGGICGCGA